MELLNNGNLVQPIDACRHEHDKSLLLRQNVVDDSCISIKIGAVETIEKIDPFDAVTQHRRSFYSSEIEMPVWSIMEK